MINNSLLVVFSLGLYACSGENSFTSLASGKRSASAAQAPEQQSSDQDAKPQEFEQKAQANNSEPDAGLSQDDAKDEDHKKPEKKSSDSKKEKDGTCIWPPNKAIVPIEIKSHLGSKPENCSVDLVVREGTSEVPNKDTDRQIDSASVSSYDKTSFVLKLKADRNGGNEDMSGGSVNRYYQVEIRCAEQATKKLLYLVPHSPGKYDCKSTIDSERYKD